MISEAQRAEIRRLFFAEHWRVGTIASALGLHPDTVRRALESERFRPQGQHRTSALDPYLAFIRQTLEQHPRLRATRVHEMIAARGYRGSVQQTRRAVRRLRPESPAEAYLRLAKLPAEDYGKAGVMWASRARLGFRLRIARGASHNFAFEAGTSQPAEGGTPCSLDSAPRLSSRSTGRRRTRHASIM